MIGGAFMLSSERSVAAPDPRVEAVVAPAPDRSFIEVADADGDGIADWKQTFPTLTGTARSASSTEPETHTRALAVSMLQRLMQSSMSGAFGERTVDIAADTDAYIRSLASDELATEADITLSGDTSVAALRAYGNGIARIVRDNAMEGSVDTELQMLGRALRNNDPDELSDLSRIAASYEGMITDMRDLPVPRTLAKEHLDLLNTYRAMHTNIRAFEGAFTDPVYALARFQRHEDDMRGVWQAIVNLYTTLHEEGVRWTDGDIAEEFITVTE